MANRWAYFQLHYYFEQNTRNMERYLAVFSELLSAKERCVFKSVAERYTFVPASKYQQPI